MDEIINYRDLDESEKEQCLDELFKISFSCPGSNAEAIKFEMTSHKKVLYPNLSLCVEIRK